MGREKKVLDWSDFPEGFTPFFLDPAGAHLETKELAPGVYALLSSIPNVDNAGFVVGDRGVLVIDAHINVAMARQIQERVREVTDKPILYLVNSNYHGDHTFGNCAFPEETLVIQHRRTAELVPFLDEEMEFMLPCVGGDRAVFEGVTLRPPDAVLDGYLLYLSQVTAAVRHGAGAGWSLEEAMEKIPLDMGQPYSPPGDHPRIDFFRDLHAYNVQKTYRSIAGNE